MNIAHFDDLLQAARAQDQTQRLLLVFARVELPEDASPQQRQGFEAGQGGTLAPVMCVDKDPHELASFAALVAEADGLGAPWGLVLAGALSGQHMQAPSEAAVQAALERLVQRVQQGVLEGLIPFERSGDAVAIA